MFGPPVFVTEGYDKRHLLLSRLRRSAEYHLLCFAALSPLRVLGTVGNTIAWPTFPRSLTEGMKVSLLIV